MLRRQLGHDASLAEQIEDSVRNSTSDRVRDLAVEESDEIVIVRGQVRSRHTKQLALYAALQLLPGGRLRDQIVVS